MVSQDSVHAGNLSTDQAKCFKLTIDPSWKKQIIETYNAARTTKCEGLLFFWLGQQKTIKKGDLSKQVDKLLSEAEAGEKPFATSIQPLLRDRANKAKDCETLKD